MKRLVALGLVMALMLTLAIPTAVSATGVSGTVDAQPVLSGISPSNANSIETGSPITVNVTITGSGFGPDAVITIDPGITVGYTGSETSFYVNSTTLHATFSIPAGTTVTAGNKTVTVNQGGRNPVTTTFTVIGWTDVNAPTSFNMGVMAVGATTEESGTGGSIQTNDANWEVDAQDANTGSNSGYMTTSSGTPLHSPLCIGSAPGPTSPASTGFAYKSSTQTGKSLPFYADQLVSGSDTPGTYSITINFTGSAK